MYSCGSNGNMETSASLVNAITDNILFHSGSHINQMLPQIVHFLRFCLVDMMMFPKILYSTGLGQGCSVAINLEVHKGNHDLGDYCTFGLPAECRGRHSLRTKITTMEKLSMKLTMESYVAT